MTDKIVDPLHQSLPAYGLIYFKHLLGQYETLPEDALARPEAVKMKKILDEHQKEPQKLSWKDLYVFDMLLVKILPPEKLRRKVWNLRARYREVAGIREYDAYLASKPPDLASEVDTDKSDDIVRADIDFLMSEIYVRYAMEPVRQLERNVLSRKLAKLASVGIIMILLFGFLAPIYGSFAGSVFIVAMFSGAMGGLISMLQRFQNLTNDGDPVHNVSQMTYGHFGTSISAITGAVSAVVLLMVFEAGLLSGALFPAPDGTPSATDASPSASVVPSEATAVLSTAIVKPASSNDAPPETERNDRTSFLYFFSRVGPKSIEDFAKLIVWCFIAGFAERFVPDTLSRFVSRRQTGRETGS